jgi:hypothetical protein
MQRWSFLILLTIVMLGSCQKGAPIGPPDLHYKRWHLKQTRTLDSNVWRTFDTDAYYTREYRPDGSILYARNGVPTQAGCCQPTQVSRQGLVLTYTAWNLCPLAFCATVKLDTITQLTDTLLELNNGYSVSQYSAAR